MYVLATKLCRLKKVLAPWSKETFGDIFSKLQELEDKVQALEEVVQQNPDDDRALIDYKESVALLQRQENATVEPEHIPIQNDSVTEDLNTEQVPIQTAVESKGSDEASGTTKIPNALGRELKQLLEISKGNESEERTKALLEAVRRINEQLETGEQTETEIEEDSQAGVVPIRIGTLNFQIDAGKLDEIFAKAQNNEGSVEDLLADHFVCNVAEIIDGKKDELKMEDSEYHAKLEKAFREKPRARVKRKNEASTSGAKSVEDPKPEVGDPSRPPVCQNAYKDKAEQVRLDDENNGKERVKAANHVKFANAGVENNRGNNKGKVIQRQGKGNTVPSASDTGRRGVNLGAGLKGQDQQSDMGFKWGRIEKSEGGGVKVNKEDEGDKRKQREGCETKAFEPQEEVVAGNIDNKGKGLEGNNSESEQEKVEQYNSFRRSLNQIHKKDLIQRRGRQNLKKEERNI
nr:uncharacterized protein LOC109157602 [Ipomoea batatas]